LLLGRARRPSAGAGDGELRAASFSIEDEAGWE
jgi:hypothetical protein